MLRVKDVAKLLNVSEGLVYKWMRRKNNPIPFYKNDGVTRFDKDEVIEWFKTGEV
ncbi:MAG TPA: helix-turn-helix domain-containing protein [Bacteroidales bacterium]|nr:helix-turn-helix domain-containing protein [Bacteroidales bacterium]